MMIDKELLAIEKVNLDRIRYRDSREYLIGKKLVRLRNELCHGKFKLQFERIIKKRKLKKIQEKNITDNVDETEWLNELHHGSNSKKVVVYTCITGGYDEPCKPLFFAKNIDYVLFTTDEVSKYFDSGWITKKVPDKLLKKDNAMINRYIKFHPFELFENDYDIAIYLDGNIQPISDLSVWGELIDSEIGFAMHKHRSRNCIYQEIKACMVLKKGNSLKLRHQKDDYFQSGFPLNYGMLECNAIATNLHIKNARKIFDAWWQELLRSQSGRDQISLPFVLWKNEIPVSSVGKLGNNIYMNSKLFIYSHREGTR